MENKTDKPRVEDILKGVLDQLTGATWVREYRPCPTRLWRLDLAIPKLRIAVEIDGHRFHSSAKQQRSDCEKNNYLVSLGWKVLRYPASSVLAKNRRVEIATQIHRVVCGVFDPERDANVLTGEAA